MRIVKMNNVHNNERLNFRQHDPKNKISCRVEEANLTVGRYGDELEKQIPSI